MNNPRPNEPNLAAQSVIFPSAKRHEATLSQARNQIACESCRLHKQKCDGTVPCARCSRRGSECVYREKMRPCRQRRSGRRSTTPTGPAPKTVVLRHAFPGVRATQPISDSRISELYYGPSSNFSIMQQLYLGLGHSKSNTQDPPAGGVQDVGEGLDEFQYRKVCFHSQLQITTKLDSGTLLPGDLQNYFDTYFDVAHSAFPIIQKEDLQPILGEMQDPSAPSLDSIDRAVVLATLAIGAIFCKAKNHGENLADAAQAIVDGSHGIINTQVIVVNFLIAVFHICLGRYNLAYLQLGTACRVAYAVGIHESTPEPSDHSASTKCHKVIYWSLFVQECLLIPVLCRPTMLSLDDALVPSPTEWPLLSSLVYLSKAFPLIQEMHSDHLTLGTVPKNCDQLVRHLEDVARHTKQFTGLDLDGNMQAESFELPYILLKLEYEQAVMLVHRPLLIMRAVTMRFIQNKSTREAAEKLISESTTTRANHAVCSAQRLISVVDQVLTQTNYATCFTKMAFYLESACFVLILNSIGPQGSLTANSTHIEKAVGALAKLTNKKSILDVIVGIRTMLDRALVTTLATMTTDDGGPWQSPCESVNWSPEDSQQSEVGSATHFRELDSGQDSGTYMADAINERAANQEESPQHHGRHLQDQDVLRDDTLARINLALDWLANSYLT